MAAIVEATRAGRVPAKVQCVVAPASDVPAVAVAEGLGVPVAVVPPGEGYGERLVAALAGSEWVCLAGFTRLLPDEVLRRFPRRVLNIHPSLLPKFGGKGMYGIRVHEAVVAAGEMESGCTVHYVTEHYDEGEVVLQMRCPVMPDDTPASLAERVLAVEHQAYPEALRRVLNEQPS
jgi:phosphoribosylglycinamide formyltransferase-1